MISVSSSGIENVKGGIKEEGEFEMRRRRAGVRREEGDMKRVVLWIFQLVMGEMHGVGEVHVCLLCLYRQLMEWSWWAM